MNSQFSELAGVARLTDADVMFMASELCGRPITALKQLTALEALALWNCLRIEAAPMRELSRRLIAA